MPSVSWRSPNTLKPTEALHQKEAETSSSATKVDPPKDVIECLFKGHITDIDWLGKLSCTFKSLRGQRPGPAFHDQDKNHIIPLESEVWLTDGLCSSVPWRTPFEDCDHLKVGSQSLVSLLKRQTTTPGTVPDFYVSAKTLQQHPENWETHAASHSLPARSCLTTSLTPAPIMGSSSDSASCMKGLRLVIPRNGTTTPTELPKSLPESF